MRATDRPQKIRFCYAYQCSHPIFLINFFGLTAVAADMGQGRSAGAARDVDVTVENSRGSQLRAPNPRLVEIHRQTLMTRGVVEALTDTAGLRRSRRRQQKKAKEP